MGQKDMSYTDRKLNILMNLAHELNYLQVMYMANAFTQMYVE